MPLPDLIVLRHGETEWNRAGRWQGDLDSPLTETGRLQARAMGDTLARHGISGASHRAYTSPQGRARRTARIALGAHWPLTEDARLREIGVGDWTGRTLDEIRHAAPPEACDDPLGLYEAAPGGEGFDALAARVRGFLAGLDGPSVIVTHGITSRMIRTLATGRGLDRLDEMPGGQGIVFRVQGGKHEVLDA